MINTIESPYVHAGNETNFDSLVLKNSDSGPVLLNFWSKKAGPCLRLYPILDKVIHHFGGKILLVNIDVDKEVSICKTFGIASVPTLKLIRQQEVQETLFGYQSEADLLRSLEKYSKNESDKALAEALSMYAQGEHSVAFEMIANAIVADPTNCKLPETMCKILIHEKRYGDATNLIGSLPNDMRDDNKIKRLIYLLEFHAVVAKNNEIDILDTQANNEPVNLQHLFFHSAHCVINQDYEQALQSLERIIDQDANYQDNIAKQALTKVLFILGEAHELVDIPKASEN
ncbi:MAG: thioredoxin family protein [Thiohalomonadales bacterium]